MVTGRRTAHNTADNASLIVRPFIKPPSRKAVSSKLKANTAGVKVPLGHAGKKRVPRLMHRFTSCILAFRNLRGYGGEEKWKRAAQGPSGLQSRFWGVGVEAPSRSRSVSPFTIGKAIRVMETPTQITASKREASLNQVPPLTGYNLFLSDRALVEAVRREDAGWAEPRLMEVG